MPLMREINDLEHTAVSQARVFPPGKHIKDKLKERGWTQINLAFVLGRTRTEISYLINTRKKLSPQVAQELALVFGDSPEYWLSLDNAYQLSQTEYPDTSIRDRSELFSYPIKEMQKRKWIAEVSKAEELEDEFKRFFGEDMIQASFRRTMKDANLNGPEQAWFARATQLAKVCPVDAFEDSKLPTLEMGLRRLAAKSKAVHRIPGMLAKYGIRFVVIQPLTRVKIDGAAFWLDPASPVIAMSIRYDNIGSFWFTLMHEFFHIKHKDKFSLDDLDSSSSEAVEVRANEAAADSLVPQRELDTFIMTYRPSFSEALINHLATKLEIHPGIIVGQLQHRKEIGFSIHRKLTVKVRELVTAIAFTDGWGHPVPLASHG